MRTAWNSTLRPGKGLKRGSRLRPISKTADRRFKLHKRWVFSVYKDQLRLGGYPEADLKVGAPCQCCGRVYGWKELTLDHVRSRNSRPDLKWSPSNYGILSKVHNERKGGQSVPDYRDKDFKRLLGLRAMVDGSWVGNRWKLSVE